MSRKEKLLKWFSVRIKSFFFPSILTSENREAIMSLPSDFSFLLFTLSNAKHGESIVYMV